MFNWIRRKFQEIIYSQTSRNIEEVISMLKSNLENQQNIFSIFTEIIEKYETEIKSTLQESIEYKIKETYKPIFEKIKLLEKIDNENTELKKQKINLENIITTYKEKNQELFNKINITAQKFNIKNLNICKKYLLSDPESVYSILMKSNDKTLKYMRNFFLIFKKIKRSMNYKTDSDIKLLKYLAKNYTIEDMRMISVKIFEELNDTNISCEYKIKHIEKLIKNGFDETFLKSAKNKYLEKYKHQDYFNNLSEFEKEIIEKKKDYKNDWIHYLNKLNMQIKGKDRLNSDELFFEIQSVNKFIEYEQINKIDLSTYTNKKTI